MLKRCLGFCAGVVVVVGLAGSIGCSNDDDPTNPGGGGTGGTADIDVVSSTPASGDTNISGTGVTVATTLEDADTTRVAVTGTSDGNLRQVLVYFTTATGAVEAVSYWWGAASINENIVYCPVAGCTAVTVDIVNRAISFAGTALDNNGNPGPGDPPTKFATLGLAVPASMVIYPAP